MNSDEHKTRDELISELRTLKERLALLESRRLEQTVPSSVALEEPIRKDADEAARALQALEDSLARLQAVVGHMPVMLDAFDESGRIVFWNRQCEKVTGYTLEDMTASPDPMALLYPDPEYLQHVYDRVALAGGEFLDFEFDITCKDGSVRTISWSNSSRHAPIPGWKTWAVGVDVTGRKRVEQALRESERTYKSVVENMQDVFYRTDKDGYLIMVSPSSAAMFGFDSPDEAIGRHASSFYAFAEDREKAFEELRRNGRTLDFETTFLRKDGSTFHASANSAYYHDESGNVLGVEGVLKDITQQKLTQERILRSEAKFRALFDHAGEGIFIADVNSDITDANLAAASMLGYDSPDEIIGLNARDVIHPEDLLERSARLNLDEVRSSEIVRIERRYRRKDGSFLPVLVTIKFIGESGIHHVLFTDISERKRMEEALRTRIVALTQPVDDASGITFEALFDLGEIQRIQDEFATATGVASVITRPDGEPLTRPSNFRTFCRDFVRNSRLGMLNCRCSDALLGEGFEDGPRVQKCLSAGLWDAGASINVGGKHVANWLIGQVRSDEPTEAQVRTYLQEIGVRNEEEALQAFRDVPTMPLERFRAIARAQHTLARHISVLAYQNLQQARFIQAKNAAEGSNRMLARLLNTSDSIATLKDTSLRYLMVNDEFLRLTGIRSHADVIGKTDREVLANIVKPEDLQRYAEGDRQALALARGSVLTFEERYEWDNGQDRFFQTKKFLVFDDAEEATAVGSLSTEITEVKRIQGRLAKEKARAEAASRAKNEFLANMSHEIRTPLNGINGMMQLLQTTDLDREQEEYVDMAVRSTGRLTRLLTDILDISRIEAGKLEFLRQKFRVRDLTQSVSELFDVTHSQKGVPLLCRIDPDTPDVLVGDEARIRQILFNLVGNAFKFTEKGSITLEIYPVFSPKQDQRRIVFSVHDTGIGIPEDKLRNLFAPFAQVETAYNRNYQGAGLGLAIVRRLATLMGGHIVMDTVPGEGTSAHVVLPFDSPEAAREGQDSAPENAVNALGPLRVLLVEDDQSNRFFMEKLLEKAGATTVTAGNGSEALEFWESENFDCILMDIQMPIMDGVEATKHIRSSQTGTKARIPIIALTSYAMTGDREKFLAAGMDAYLGKPVQFADLLQVLTTVCRPLEQTGRDNLPNVEGE